MTLILQIVLIVFSLLIIGNVFTTVLQDLFIFRPTKLKQDYEYQFNLNFTEHFIKSSHHGKINLLWFHHEDKKRPLIFYCHGNSSHLQSWGEVAERYDKLGYDVIIYDYRGFGKSVGRRNQETFIDDVRAVFNFAMQYYSLEQTVVYGRSMGTGVASLIASEQSPTLLILETPYYSIPELFKSYYPFLPKWLFVFKYVFPTNEWIQKVDCPIYIFQGTRDTVVPYRCAVKLKPLLAPPENFITISGGKHSNLKEFPEFTDNVRSILRKHCPPNELP